MQPCEAVQPSEATQPSVAVQPSAPSQPSGGVGNVDDLKLEVYRIMQQILTIDRGGMWIMLMCICSGTLQVKGERIRKRRSQLEFTNMHAPIVWNEYRLDEQVLMTPIE